jgi:hypothetical protein
MRRTVRAGRAGIAWGIGALAMASCGTPTELWLVIDTNVRIEGSAGTSLPALSTVRIQVSVADSATPFWNAPYDVSRGGLAIPGHVVVRPSRGDESRRVRVRVSGQLSNGAELRQDALVSFARGRRITLQMFLAGECLGAQQERCEAMGQTCGEGGGCIPVERRDLPDFDNDAGRRDVAAFDGGSPSDATMDVMPDVALDVPSFDASGDVCVSAVERSALSATVIAAGAPRLIAPVSGSLVSGSRPTLRWEAVGGASAYEVQLCRDYAMTTRCRMGSSASTQWLVDSALESGLWFWRVRPAAGTYGLVWNFFARTGADGRAWPGRFDLDSDGREDVAVGSREVNLIPSGHGSIRLIYGGFVRTATPPATLIARGACGEESFANRLANGGDINGDGFSDLVASALSIGARGLPGALGVFFGGRARLTMGARAEQVFVDADVTRLFGSSIAGLGDVNGDGYADVAVGSQGVGMTPSAGQVFIFHGSATGLSRMPARVLTEGVGADLFGSTVSAVGDVNGDGFADLAVAAVNETGRGVVRLYLGSASGVSATAAQTMTGNNAQWRFGTAIAGAFDADNDGWPDLAIGAPSTRGAGGTNAPGEAVIYRNRGGAAGAVFEATGQRFTRVAGEPYAWGNALVGGDLNGDGFDELVVAGGGTGNASFGRTEGTSFAVFNGSPTGLAEPRSSYVMSTQGVPIGEGFAARDLDNDGFFDLIVSVPVVNASGRLDFYFSSAAGIPMPATTRLQPSTTRYDRFGEPIACASQRWWRRFF